MHNRSTASRRSLPIAGTVTGLFALMATTLPAQAAPLPAIPAETPPSDTAPAYLQGFQQPQQLCPGGALVGKVSEAIVDPTVAVAGGKGECTLADMKSANPHTTFYAYMNLGAMSERQPENGAFQRTCADPRTDGRQFAVRTDNDRVAKNAEGMATYPNWSYMTVADLSTSYADACATAARALLEAPSLKGRVTDAKPAKFDGVFFDDVAMTAGHGQDMDWVGQWGPWKDDNAYAISATAAIDSIDNQLDKRFDRDVPLGINLGIYPDKQANVDRALELARTDAVDLAMREFTTQDRSGNPLSADYLTTSIDVNSQLTEAGMPMFQNDYAMPMRSVGASGYAQGAAVSGDAACLHQGNDEQTQAVLNRRDLDYRMLLGQTLLTRDSEARDVQAMIPQVEECRDHIGSDTGMAEKVVDRTVDMDSSGVRELREAVNEGVYGTGEHFTRNGVIMRELSNGRYVLVNPNSSSREVEHDGKKWSVPGRSAALAG